MQHSSGPSSPGSKIKVRPPLSLDRLEPAAAAVANTAESPPPSLNEKLVVVVVTGGGSPLLSVEPAAWWCVDKLEATGA